MKHLTLFLIVASTAATASPITYTDMTRAGLDVRTDNANAFRDTGTVEAFSGFTLLNEHINRYGHVRISADWPDDIGGVFYGLDQNYELVRDYTLTMNEGQRWFGPDAYPVSSVGNVELIGLGFVPFYPSNYYTGQPINFADCNCSPQYTIQFEYNTNHGDGTVYEENEHNVPEPATGFLALLGAAFIGYRRMTKNKNEFLHYVE